MSDGRFMPSNQRTAQITPQQRHYSTTFSTTSEQTEHAEYLICHENKQTVVW